MDYYLRHHERVAFEVEELLVEGVDKDLAKLRAAALVPPIGEIRTAGYKRTLRRESRAYSRASKKLGMEDGSRQEQEELALETLNRYAAIGRQHNDEWLPDFVDRTVGEYVAGTNEYRTLRFEQIDKGAGDSEFPN